MIPPNAVFLFSLLTFVALLIVILAKDYADRVRSEKFDLIAGLLTDELRNRVAGSDEDAQIVASQTLNSETDHA